MKFNKTTVTWFWQIEQTGSRQTKSTTAPTRSAAVLSKQQSTEKI